MEQRDTMLGKSDVVLDEEKLSADTSTNIIFINILNIPVLIYEYRYNEFEQSGRLS